MSVRQPKLGPRAATAGPVAESQEQPRSQPVPQQQQPQHQVFDPSMVKLTRGTSCVLCQQRKVRCDKNKPCANCVKVGVECRVVPPQPPRRRKKRFQERDLVERLRKYESLLAEHGIKFDAIGQDFKFDHSAGAEDVDELENDFDALKTSPETSASPSQPPRRMNKPGSSIFSLHREFRASERLLHDSSEDEDHESTIHRAFDKMFNNDDGFPFVFTGRQMTTAHLHPSPIHMFQLWQVYIDRVNSLLKVTHVPTIQGLIVKTSSNMETASKTFEALMFGIYAMAVTSMEDDEVEVMLNMRKHEALAQFLTAAQQALLNAGFMRNHDLSTLQAYLLYLLAIRWSVDPRQVFCLIGIAIRIAQRMGLHRDPAGYDLQPFEVEQRRRLWWTIVSYDRRIGEMTGSTVTALSSGGDCKLPLNVNDSDLHENGTDLPTSHTGPTEMLFALTRLEIAMAVASNSNRDSAKINADKPSPSSHPDSSKQSSLVTIRIAGQDSVVYSMDEFHAHMESAYLAHCDPKIPLHFFTITMTRQALSKMRVISYLLRMYTGDDPLQDTERDALFMLSIQMVEFDNVVHSSDSLKPYKWFTAHHFPFPAYMFLVQELRGRCYGPEVERAWDAIVANHSLRGLIHHMHSPMHAAFGRYFIKAWDAHEDAFIARGREPPPRPNFVSILRDRADKKPSVAHDSSRLDASPNVSETNVMMTPLSIGHFPKSSAASSVNAAPGPPPVQDTSEMDWTYLMSNLTPDMTFGSALSGFPGFIPFEHGPVMGQGTGRMY